MNTQDIQDITTIDALKKYDPATIDTRYFRYDGAIARLAPITMNNGTLLVAAYVLDSVSLAWSIAGMTREAKIARAYDEMVAGKRAGFTGEPEIYTSGWRPVVRTDDGGYVCELR